MQNKIIWRYVIMTSFLLLAQLNTQLRITAVRITNSIKVIKLFTIKESVRKYFRLVNIKNTN